MPNYTDSGTGIARAQDAGAQPAPSAQCIGMGRNTAFGENRTHGHTETRGGATLELVVAPSAGGRFAARLDGRELCASTKPFLDAARVLMAEGVDPATVLQMRHADSATVAMRSTVGTAAGLTVLEGDLGPRFAQWRAFGQPISLADYGAHAAKTLQKAA
jgi:hypothetical protein